MSKINNNSTISYKINDIAKILQDFNIDNNISLLGGYAGIALFYNYYGKYSKKEDYAEKSFTIISNIFDKISSGELYPTFAGGLAGIGWLIEFLEQNDFIESDTDEL